MPPAGHGAKFRQQPTRGGCGNELDHAPTRALAPGRRAPGGDTYHALKKTFRELDLHTVCEEARCPNVGECWREGTATVMLLGEVCTRGCRFCAVTTGDPRGAVDSREPEHTARAIARLDLQYVVMTMVDRDDLLDGGAEHVARTVKALRALRPDILVETLVGDFGGHLGCVDAVVDGGPDAPPAKLRTAQPAAAPARERRIHRAAWL